MFIKTININLIEIYVYQNNKYMFIKTINIAELSLKLGFLQFGVQFVDPIIGWANWIFSQI